MSRLTGTVKFFDTVRGFGFIRCDDPNQSDVFLHATALPRAGFDYASEHQRIEFEIVENKKNGRPMAGNVRFLDPIISPRRQPPSFAEDRAESDVRARACGSRVHAGRGQVWRIKRSASAQ